MPHAAAENVTALEDIEENMRNALVEQLEMGWCLPRAGEAPT